MLGTVAALRLTGEAPPASPPPIVVIRDLIISYPN